MESTETIRINEIITTCCEMRLNPNLKPNGVADKELLFTLKEKFLPFCTIARTNQKQKIGLLSDILYILQQQGYQIKEGHLRFPENLKELVKEWWTDHSKILWEEA